MFIHCVFYECVVMLTPLRRHTELRVRLLVYMHKHIPTHKHRTTTRGAMHIHLTGSIHNGKQTVISRFQAASQLRSILLLVCPRLWGGAAAVGFNKSIVFGSCLKGLSFILEYCCCRCCCTDVDMGGERAIALGHGGSEVQCHCCALQGLVLIV